MKQVLIVDDDIELCDMVAEYLQGEGFQVTTSHNGQTGVDMVFSEESHYDLMILDVMLPGLNGFDCLREIRKSSQIPILMLTARGEDIDRIVGLEMGADDYLAKPFNPRELVARIKAVLRRFQASGTTHDEPSVLSNGEIEVHPAARRVMHHGNLVDLTSTEYNLLEVLIKNAGSVVDKATLSSQALGRKLAFYDRSIDMHVSKLRKKIGCSDEGEQLIQTVRGIGYQLIKY